MSSGFPGVWSSERGPLNVGYVMAANSSSQITFETGGRKERRKVLGTLKINSNGLNSA